jgi:hypothetical protein
MAASTFIPWVILLKDSTLDGRLNNHKGDRRNDQTRKGEGSGNDRPR